MNHSKKSTQAGFGLIEVVFGVVIISLVLFALIDEYNTYLRNVFRVTQKIQSAFLAEEGIEALRVMRDTDWNSSFGTFTPGTTYYFYWNGTTWTATTSMRYIDNVYLRSFTVAAVNRDSNDRIAASGTNDPGTKKATVSVRWFMEGATSTVTLATYFTNLFSN